MKKTLILLLILLALAGIYYYSFSGTDSTSIAMADRSFIGQNPKDIHTLTIKSKARPLIHLSKKNSAWYINQKYRASNNMMNNIVSALGEMEIKYVPTSNENKTIHERINTFGLEVKTYDASGTLLNDFIVGPNTNDEYGTYFLNKGADQIYAMHLPSQEGGIRNLFIHDVENFRDLNIIDFKADDIVKISMDYPKDVGSSFALHKEKNLITLENSRGKKITELNQKIAQSFFASCEKVNAEALNNQHEQKEEILEFIPFAKIGITLRDKKEVWLSLYPTVDLDSNYNTRSAGDVTTRHEKYYVSTSWGDFYRVQSRFLSKFLKTPAYFQS